MRKTSILGTIAGNYKRKATTSAVRAGYKLLGGEGSSPGQAKRKKK